MKLIAIIAAILSIFVATDPVQAANIFNYTSSRSSWVGGGATRSITPAQGFGFSGHRYFNQGAYTNDLSFSVSNSSEWWYLDFLGPNNTLAVVGSYPNAQRYPFEGPGRPGLSFVGNGRGDNTLTGQFQVLEAVIDTAGNIQKYAVDFTQYDEGNTSAWNIGSFRFNSDVPVGVPGAIDVDARFLGAGNAVRYSA